MHDRNILLKFNEKDENIDIISRVHFDDFLTFLKMLI
jgi:hypothetical protein